MTENSALTVVQITDTHLFASDETTLLGLPTAQSLQVVLEHLKTYPSKPDLIILTGDLSQDETPASYQRLYALMAALNIPIYWIPGNHDVPHVMEPILTQAPLSDQKSFVAGGWHFILLNSAKPGQVDGALSPTSLQWLNQQLQQAAPHPTVLAMHHPPFLIGSDWMDDINLQNADQLFAVIDRYSHVKVVLFGHIHQEFVGERRGVQYLGTPSSCVQFKPQSRKFTLDELKPGFRVLSLQRDGRYTTQVERVMLNHVIDLTAVGY